MKQSRNPQDLIEFRGRRARKALAVRRALFEAGLVAFERQPIALVSVLDITEAADVAKGVFYLQFRSKDEFLLALWQDVQLRCLEVLRSKASEVASGSRVPAVVSALLGYFGQRESERRFWIRMTSFFVDEVGLPGELRRIRDDYARGLAAILEDTDAEQVTGPQLESARVVDAMCWATLAAESFVGRPLLARDAIVAAAIAAAHVANTGGHRRGDENRLR